jgi:hypothetical protein
MPAFRRSDRRRIGRRTRLAPTLVALGVGESNVTKSDKVKVLFEILKLAPMTRSKPAFGRYADAGDLDSFWTYYENSIRARADVRKRVEDHGEISFERLQPAMNAVYGLATKD